VHGNASSTGLIDAQQIPLIAYDIRSRQPERLGGVSAHLDVGPRDDQRSAAGIGSPGIQPRLIGPAIDSPVVLMARKRQRACVTLHSQRA